MGGGEGARGEKGGFNSETKMRDKKLGAGVKKKEYRAGEE